MELGGWSVVSMQKASLGDAPPRGAFYEVCGISTELSRKFCAAVPAGAVIDWDVFGADIATENVATSAPSFVSKLQSS